MTAPSKSGFNGMMVGYYLPCCLRLSQLTRTTDNEAVSSDHFALIRAAVAGSLRVVVLR
jgi:hypothetical protein